MQGGGTTQGHEGHQIRHVGHRQGWPLQEAAGEGCQGQGWRNCLREKAKQNMEMPLQESCLQLPRTEKPPRDWTWRQLPSRSPSGSQLLQLLVSPRASALWVRSAKCSASSAVPPGAPKEPQSSSGAGKVLGVVSPEVWLLWQEATAGMASQGARGARKERNEGDEAFGDSRRRDGNHHRAAERAGTHFRGSHLASSHLTMQAATPAKKPPLSPCWEQQICFPAPLLNPPQCSS